MKFTIEAAQIARAMKQVASVAVKNGPMPVLANVLIECEPDRVSLTTSNGDQWITRILGGDVSKPGATTVEAGRLASVLGALDSGAICEIAGDDSGVTLKGGRSRFKFGALPARIYPRPSDVEGEPVTFGDDLFSAIKAVRHGIPATTTMPALLGVYVHWDNGTLTVRSSDGNREPKWTVPNAAEMTALLPTVCVDTLLRMADDSDSAVSIVTTPRLASFDFGNVRMVSKLLDGKWPREQLERMTPTTFAHSVTFNRADFARALQRLALIDDGKDRAVEASFDGDQATLTSITTRDSGSEAVPCDYAGKPFRIGMRTGNVLQAMDALGTETITIGMNGPNDPTMITASDQPNGCIMVMPYRIAQAGEGA